MPAQFQCSRPDVVHQRAIRRAARPTVEIARTYGKVTGLTSATFGGTLTVTRLGGTFQLADSFQLSSVASASDFTATNLPTISPLQWNWNPAAGTLSVVSAINTTPTNLTVALSAGNLNLSWPADHVGWRLLAQTNHLAAGVSCNSNDWACRPPFRPWPSRDGLDWNRQYPATARRTVASDNLARLERRMRRGF